jgi:hypothetical protein
MSMGCASDPEANSGPDAFLSSAEAMKVGELSPGDLDADEGDTTDWKAVTLESGAWQLEFTTDAKGAEVAVGVYDRYGELVAAGVRKGAASDPLRIAFEARDGGRFFVRLEHRGGGRNTYGLTIDGAEGKGGGGPLID